MHSYTYGSFVSVAVLIRLNPCFNGRCTRTDGEVDGQDYLVMVLILVLMEDALVRADFAVFEDGEVCLNPCFNGRCTRTAKLGLCFV